MPFALCSTISSWIWMSLQHTGFFHNDPLWDSELLKDPRLQIYELVYSFQQFLLILALAILASQPADFWYVVCFSSTCALLTCYLISCSRTPLQTDSINTPVLVFATLCTIQSVFASKHWSLCVHQEIAAIALVVLGLSSGFLHLSAQGEFSAGTIIACRTLISCFYCLYFIITLGIGANTACIWTGPVKNINCSISKPPHPSYAKLFYFGKVRSFQK